VKEQIKRRLLQEKKKEAVDKFIEDLKQKTEVEVLVKVPRTYEYTATVWGRGASDVSLGLTTASVQRLRI
jgi:hypothetical protein